MVQPVFYSARRLILSNNLPYVRQTPAKLRLIGIHLPRRIIINVIINAITRVRLWMSYAGPYNGCLKWRTRTRVPAGAYWSLLEPTGAYWSPLEPKAVCRGAYLSFVRDKYRTLSSSLINRLVEFSKPFFFHCFVRIMDSEIESLRAPSTTQDSVETGSKKSKRGNSAHTTWVHARTARDGEDSRLIVGKSADGS
jgi:hypothetical protein